MAKVDTYPHLAPRFTWRAIKGLFDAAWNREQQRRRRWLAAILLAIAASALGAFLNGAGGGKAGGPSGNSAPSTNPNGDAGRALPAATRVIFVSQPADKPIPVGVTGIFRVQVLSRLHRPIDRAGILVRLNQIVYTAVGVTRGAAIINGKRVGHFGLALTNARGVATFKVTGTKTSVQPTSFVASLPYWGASLRGKARSSYGASGYLEAYFSAAKH